MIAVDAVRPREWRAELGTGAGLLLLSPLAVGLALVFLAPLGWLVWISLAAPDVSLDAYRELFSRSVGRRAFANTATISVTVTCISVVIGAFLAWQLRTARSRWYRALLWATLLLPAWTSVIIRNYALTILLQRNGLVNDALQGSRVTGEPLAILYTPGSVVVGMVHSLVPYAALPIYAALRMVDDDLLAAARGLGASQLRLLTTVVLPLIRSSVLAAAAIVLVVASGFYVTPTVLGGPENLVAATLVDQQVNILFDVQGAAAASVVLLVSGLALLGTVGALVGWHRLERALR